MNKFLWIVRCVRKHSIHEELEATKCYTTFLRRGEYGVGVKRSGLLRLSSDNNTSRSSAMRDTAAGLGENCMVTKAPKEA
jgi:hypothetical protein